jgi:hypothetical protein
MKEIEKHLPKWVIQIEEIKALAMKRIANEQKNKKSSP